MTDCELAWCEGDHSDGYHASRRWHWDGKTIAVEVTAALGVLWTKTEPPWPKLRVRDAEGTGEVEQTIRLEELDELIGLLTRARRDVADAIKFAEEASRFPATT